jgi:hypothetical protein
MAEQTPFGKREDKEPAEGSRETVNANIDDAGARERFRDANRGGSVAGGITNRPLEEENENQEEVPPRGATKGENQSNPREVTPPHGDAKKP